MNNRKIDIYVNGKYECSTTWSKTCKEAVSGFIDKHYKTLFFTKAVSVKAYFAK
jgi:hypothetical protein